MRIALDSSVLLHAEGVSDQTRQSRALAVIAALPESDTIIPVQALCELLQALVVTARMPAAQAREAVASWRRAYRAQDTTESVLVAAADLVALQKFGVWDAVVLASAAEAGCDVLLSEGIESRRPWRGVTIVNPFTEPPHPLLAEILGGGR